ncbi:MULTISPECIES: VanZ family protein [unclassified Nocardiopsis]|uniref:VanZ family protein n=1 Tax=unclassified Nocardiopsis TaxID=2649073 RepID=UPI00135690CD|nr:MULTISPECIES: VanZ family protein [unclassified Nocardiopsis]
MELEAVKSPEGSYLSDGRSVVHSYEELSQAEREKWSNWEEYDYFAYGPAENLTVTYPDGNTVPPDEEQAVIDQMEGMVPDEEQKMEAAMERIELILAEKAVNALLFVPMAVVAFHAFSTWAPRILFGPTLSVVIEAAQWAMGAGRSTETGDVLLNTVGSLGGTLLAAGSCAIVTLAARRTKRAFHAEA